MKYEKGTHKILDFRLGKMNRIQLLFECYKVRRTLELAAKQNICQEEWFYQFPKGTCGIASEVLGLWLSRHDSSEKYEYVWGWYNGVSHAWIEHNGYVIDITADQFENIHSKVFVTKNRKFYNLFEIENRYDISEHSTTHSVKELYQFVCRNVK